MIFGSRLDDMIAEADQQLDQTIDEALASLSDIDALIKEFGGANDALFGYVRAQMRSAREAMHEFILMTPAQLLDGNRAVAGRVLEIHTRINDYRRVVEYVRSVLGMADSLESLGEFDQVTLEDTPLDDNGGGGGGRLDGDGKAAKRSPGHRVSRQSGRLRDGRQGSADGDRKPRR